jgi:hypothetical protein
MHNMTSLKLKQSCISIKNYCLFVGWFIWIFAYYRGGVRWCISSSAILKIGIRWTYGPKQIKIEVPDSDVPDQKHTQTENSDSDVPDQKYIKIESSDSDAPNSKHIKIGSSDSDAPDPRHITIEDSNSDAIWAICQYLSLRRKFAVAMNVTRSPIFSQGWHHLLFSSLNVNQSMWMMISQLSRCQRRHFALRTPKIILPQSNCTMAVYLYIPSHQQVWRLTKLLSCV